MKKDMSIYVIKRDGEKEKLDYEKINKVLLWATENISGVNASDVAMNAKLQLFDGITTSDIHRVLIQSASNMITEKNPNYQWVAANLSNYLLRKEVFGVEDNLPPLWKVIKKNIERGVYDPVILDNYTKEQVEKIENIIKHKRDYKFTYAGIQQVQDKYLLKDRVTGEIYETPQYMYIMIAMTLFAGIEDEKERYSKIKSYYNDISTFKISLPTPIIAGVRTPIKQYSSCVLVDIDDSLNSIDSGNSAILKYTARRAGIGMNTGRIRALGSKIRNGEVVHTGVIPYFKVFESTVKSCTQNGIRGGCFKKDTLVKCVESVEIDGINYQLTDKIKINDNYILVSDLLNNK